MKEGYMPEIGQKWSSLTYGQLTAMYKIFSQTENNCDIVVYSGSQAETCNSDINFENAIKSLSSKVKEDITKEIPLIPKFKSRDVYNEEFEVIGSTNEIHDFQLDHLLNIYQPDYIQHCQLDQLFGRDSIDNVAKTWQ